MGGHAKHGLGIQCENRKIFTWELPESNFLYLLDPKDIKLGGVNCLELIYFKNGKMWMLKLPFLYVREKLDC